MPSTIAFVIFVLGFASCVPHSHKRGPKENFDHGNYFGRDSNHLKESHHNNEFDHESILGSHTAADEFDHLQPEESKKRLRLLAAKMDLNKDSYVDKNELVNWIIQSFQSLTEEEALDELEDEDKDGDKKVTWEEHIAETYGVYDNELPSSSDEELSEDFQMMQNDKELFTAADANEDGILDTTEFPAFSHPEEFEHMHEIVYQQAMRKRDTNNDGFLSLEEFIADSHGSAPVPTTEHYALEKDRFNNDFDMDGDKKLNKKEVLLWLVPNNTKSAEAEAYHLIENSDNDKDGRLSIQEIVDHHEIFVGSEATDFGEQLQNSRYTDEL